MRHGKECGKMGHLILEKPRKKHVTIQDRYKNKKSQSYESFRKRGRYYRVHHYIYDEYGRRKSRFCYLGNFDGALEKLRKVKKILEKYATSKKTIEPVYDNDFFVWDLRSLKEIEHEIKQAEGLAKFKKDPDKFADVIYGTIIEAQFYLIRGDRIFRKYF